MALQRGADRDGEQRRRLDLSNAKTYWCFNKDTAHSMFACCQTAAVSKHVTECVVLTRGIFQIFFILFIFLQQCLRVFFSHPRTRRQQCKEQVGEELLPKSQRYLHFHRAISKALHLILEHPIPDPHFTTPWMMRKKAPVMWRQNGNYARFSCSHSDLLLRKKQP